MVFDRMLYLLDAFFVCLLYCSFIHLGLGLGLGLGLVLNRNYRKTHPPSTTFYQLPFYVRVSIISQARGYHHDRKIVRNTFFKTLIKLTRSCYFKYGMV